MTREEAITTLKEMHDSFDEIHENTNGDIGYEQMTAIDMAIEALHREEAEEKGYCHRIRPKEYFPSEPKVGEWTNKDGEPIKDKFCVYCSKCKEWSEYRTNYCGNCGAYMRGGED